MKRFIQLVACLYPASWRCRYEIEFAALLEDVSPGWGTFLNVLRGAMEMQIRTWNFGRILAVAGIGGALVGLAIWFAIPNRYFSVAVLKIVPSPLSTDRPATNEALANYVESLTAQSMSRSSLMQIIRKFKLYEPEQARTPLKDIADSMKKNVVIWPATRRSDRVPIAFCVAFNYSDPVVAQRVTQELVARLMRSSVENSLRDQKPGAAGVTVVDGPSLPNRPFSARLSMIMTAGIAAGLALGVVLSLIRRSMRPARSMES